MVLVSVFLDFVFFIISTIKGKQRTRTNNNEHEQYWRTRTPKTQHTQTKRNKDSKRNITCLLHSCCCSLLRVVSWSCCLFLILFSVLDVGIMFYVLLLCLYHWLWLFSVLCHWSGFFVESIKLKENKHKLRKGTRMTNTRTDEVTTHHTKHP